MSFQIAIDGPAGAGKSTIAKRIAKELGYIYVDTGAMYRAIGLHVLRSGIDPADEEAVRGSLATAEIGIRIENGTQLVFLNGEDVSRAIRTEEAGMTASKVSTYADVRTKLVAMQQEIARKNDVVMDGRDIGTVVLPDAPLKIYLTAAVETRAKRRFLELQERGESPDLAAIEEDIRRRDQQDMTREHSPLRKADDAVEVDSSELSVEEVTERILSLVRERKR